MFLAAQPSARVITITIPQSEISFFKKKLNTRPRQTSVFVLQLNRDEDRDYLPPPFYDSFPQGRADSGSDSMLHLRFLCQKEPAAKRPRKSPLIGLVFALMFLLRNMVVCDCASAFVCIPILTRTLKIARTCTVLTLTSSPPIPGTSNVHRHPPGPTSSQPLIIGQAHNPGPDLSYCTELIATLYREQW